MPRRTFDNIINDPGPRTVFFDDSHEARYVRFSNLSAPGGMSVAGAGEIEVLAASQGR